MGPSPLRHGRPAARAEESTQFLIVTDRTRLTDCGCCVWILAYSVRSSRPHQSTAEKDTLTDTSQAPHATKMTSSDRRDDSGSRSGVSREGPTGSRLFEDVSTRSILRQVPAKLEEGAARSLWRRVSTEFASAGSKGVITHLRTTFGEIDTKIREELADAKDAG